MRKPIHYSGTRLQQQVWFLGPLLSICVLWSFLRVVYAGEGEVNEALKVVVGETTIVSSQPKRIWKDNRWLWFPQINRLSTGELIVGFWMVNDERYPEGDFGGYTISQDGGRTWGRRRLRSSLAWNKHVYPDGSMIELSWLTMPDSSEQPKKITGVLTTLSDGGMVVRQEDASVSFPRPVWIEPAVQGMPGKPVPSKYLRFDGIGQRPNASMYFARSILEGKDKSLLATMYGVYEGEQARRNVVVRSEDRGRTWSYLSTICDGPMIEQLTGDAYRGCEEASLERLADGRILCVFRTASREHLFQSWSSDDGRSWTRPVSAGVGSVLPKLLMLDSGVLACSYGRPGVQIMFSLDGTGQEWTHHTEIPLGERASTCYTDMVEITPGEILLVHDTSFEDSWRNGEMDVRMTRISVSQSR